MPGEAAIIQLLVALLLVWVHAALILPRLAEPVDGPALHKPPYATLSTRGHLLALMAASLGCQMVSRLDAAALAPVWTVYGSAVLVLVWVDARTTWLPRSLTWLCAAEVLAAFLVVALRRPGGRAQLAVADLLVALGGGLAAMALFWVIWRISHAGIGFGDVRLALIVGMVAASGGSGQWWLALMLSSLTGVLWALLHGRLRARRGSRPDRPGGGKEFAYGPALWCGPYLALLLSRLLTAG